MKETPIPFGDMINIRRILIGISVLLLGTVVYVVDRPPDQIYFLHTLQKFCVPISRYNSLPNVFGFAGNSLPSFIHVFSFILITAGLSPCSQRDCLFICACWSFVDCAFELAQKFNLWAVKIIPDCFDSILFLENTKNYFTSGTFDLHDIAAIVFGTISAYFVLSATRKREQE